MEGDREGDTGREGDKERKGTKESGREINRLTVTILVQCTGEILVAVVTYLSLWLWITHLSCHDCRAIAQSAYNPGVNNFMVRSELSKTPHLSLVFVRATLGGNSHHQIPRTFYGACWVAGSDGR